MFDILKKLVLPPTFEDEETNRTVRILNIILVTLFFAAVVLSPLVYIVVVIQDPSLATDPEELLSLGLSFMLALGIVGLRFLMYRGRVRVSSWLTAGLIWLAITAVIFQFNGFRDPAAFGYALVIGIAAVLLQERRAVAFFTMLVVLSLLAIFVTESQGAVIYAPQTVTILDILIVASVFVILGLMLAYAIQNLNLALARAHESEQVAEAANQQLHLLNADLENRVAIRTQALTTSTEIGRSVSTILDKDRLVKAVADQIREAFDYYQTQVYLLDETGQTLHLVAGAGHAGNELVTRRHFVPVNKGLVGRAVRTNAPVLAPDVSQMEAWLPNPSLPGTQSELVVPISLGNRVMGVLDIQHHVRNGLGANDRDLLLSISGQVAIALQNARLLAEAQARAEQEALINQIGQQLQSTTTIEQALQIAVREVGRVVNAPQVRVRLETSTSKSSDQQGNGDRDHQLEAANRPL